MERDPNELRNLVGDPAADGALKELREAMTASASGRAIRGSLEDNRARHGSLKYWRHTGRFATRSTPRSGCIPTDDACSEDMMRQRGTAVRVAELGTGFRDTFFVLEDEAIVFARPVLV
ncbi:MAG: hypothetical protein ACRD2A_22565, partial [Vicinamibacterales bacterium]